MKCLSASIGFQDYHNFFSDTQLEGQGLGGLTLEVGFPLIIRMIQLENDLDYLLSKYSPDFFSARVLLLSSPYIFPDSKISKNTFSHFRDGLQTWRVNAEQEEYGFHKYRNSNYYQRACSALFQVLCVNQKDYTRLLQVQLGILQHNLKKNT